MPKVSLRDRLLRQRQGLAADECLRLSLLAQQNLIATDAFDAAGIIALYSAIRNEVLTDKLFAAANAAGKQTVYPRMCGDHLEFVPVDALCDLVPGRMGVPEPHDGPELALSEVDLMVVPGVGFDLSGHRLGYGRGFYDRLLGDLEQRPLLVGLAFEQQVVARLPRDPHDVHVDLLVTEGHVWRALEG